MYFKKEICIFYLKFNLVFRYVELFSNFLLSEWRFIFISLRVKIVCFCRYKVCYLKFWKILILLFIYNCEGIFIIDLSGGDE